jgi:hypothetical protein
MIFYSVNQSWRTVIEWNGIPCLFLELAKEKIVRLSFPFLPLMTLPSNYQSHRILHRKALKKE